MCLVVRGNICPLQETVRLSDLIISLMTNGKDQSQNWAEGKGSLPRYLCSVHLQPVVLSTLLFEKPSILTSRNPTENSNKLLTMLSTETKSQLCCLWLSCLPKEHQRGSVSDMAANAHQDDRREGPAGVNTHCPHNNILRILLRSGQVCQLNQIMFSFLPSC